MGVGEEVWASAPGVVDRIRMDSTSGGCDAAYANDANYVVVDHGDGSAALYLHLDTNSSSLQQGDPVCAGDVVGRVGLTGWVCGAHLHFQIQDVCNS
ncbi:MAG: M23 family metallopeptidase [Myxococcota bacterium]|jgi:murein DD-endopeptidase MepM/ murein hydrolase activator NlpD|nr:M23 family metallopeptidase [Myxococcota bacterium]